MEETEQTPVPEPIDIFHKPIIGILLAVLLAGYSATQLEPILPIHLTDQFNSRPITIGLIMMLFTLAHACATPLANYLEGPLGRVGVMALGMALSATFLPMVPMANDINQMIFILGLAGISGGLILAFAMPELAEVLSLYLI